MGGASVSGCGTVQPWICSSARKIAAESPSAYRLISTSAELPALNCDWSWRLKDKEETGQENMWGLSWFVVKQDATCRCFFVQTCRHFCWQPSLEYSMYYTTVDL